MNTTPPDEINSDVDRYLNRHPLVNKCPYEGVTHQVTNHRIELIQRHRDSDETPQWAVECLTCGATSPPETRYQDAIHVFNQDNRPLPVAIPCGFISWNGGECPVDADVEYVMKDGIRATDAANKLRWKCLNRASDIIAYRVISDPLAYIKAAHAAGQTIQRRVMLNRSLPTGEWTGEWSKWVDQVYPSFAVSPDVEWRIKPAPVMVPLGPEDVPPGSILRQRGSDDFCADLDGEWVSIVNVDVNAGVTISAIIDGKPFLVIVPWNKLTSCEINRSLPLTGRWDKDAWQPCEKEEVQP